MATPYRTPPRQFLRFFQWYCHPRLKDFIEGDLIEVYNERLGKYGKRVADLKFIIDVLLLFRPGIIRPAEDYKHSIQYGMYKNYLKVTFRVFNRERLYSLINVTGLALGFTCCVVIYLFIRDEQGYDKFHQDSERIYRVASAYMRQGQWEPYASNAWRTGELINEHFGEVEQLVKIGRDEDLFVYKDKRIYETRVAYVEDNFFRVFSFPLVSGNVAEALKGSNKVVISESMATKYFGADDPTGKVLEIRDGAVQLQVSGVMHDMPHNSHFHFDFLISNETLRQVAPESLFKEVGWDSQYLYVKLDAGVDPATLEARFPNFVDENLDYLTPANFKLFLQPLESIHLQSNIGLEIEANGSMDRVYTFSMIAVFILIIACVNYVNLTTARALRRAREVGMRKVLGAKRTDLIGQFLTESFIMTFIAIAIAFTLIAVVLPEFNRFAGKEISLDVVFSRDVMLTLMISAVAIAFVSGIYPSLVLSSFRPLNNLKGVERAGRSGFLFRRGLVGLQFVISIGLIAATAVVFQQWAFLKTKPLGVNKEMLISIPLQTMERRALGLFKKDLLANHAVKKVGTANMKMPGWISNSTP